MTTMLIRSVFLLLDFVTRLIQELYLLRGWILGLTTFFESLLVYYLTIL